MSEQGDTFESWPRCCDGPGREAKDFAVLSRVLREDVRMG